MRIMVTNRSDPPLPSWRFVGGLARVGRRRLLVPLVFLALVDDEPCIFQAKLIMDQDESKEVLVAICHLRFHPDE